MSAPTAPFVVIDNAVFRKACVLDHAGLLRLVPAGGEPARFETVEAADAAIAFTCEALGWAPEGYQVAGLADWEEEQLSPGRRRRLQRTHRPPESTAHD